MCASYLQHLSGAQLAALQEAFTGQKEPPGPGERDVRRPSLASKVLLPGGIVEAYFGVPLERKLQINGRIEAIAEKPYYRRGDWLRGVLPVSSFFEYDAGKHPIEMKTHADITFLATLHRDEHFLIITREATRQTKEIHPRLPYLLREEQIRPYLRQQLSFDTLLREVREDAPILELAGQMRLF